MRWLALPLSISVFAVVVWDDPGRRRNVSATDPPVAKERIDFGKHVKPIMESKCQPCHFPGGKMYATLPFDQPSTIVSLGEKLFTRIKDEPSQAIIRKFLAERRVNGRRDNKSQIN